MKLTRITSGGSIIPEIEGLRFCAISIVVFHHLIGQLFRLGGVQFDGSLSSRFVKQRILVAGRFGVMLFFSISGFILALRFAQQHLGGGRQVDIKAYFLRRLTRLEPPFLVNALLVLPVAIAFNGTSPQVLLEYLASIFYLHLPIYHSAPTLNGVTWSLEMEIQFYILAPLFGLIYKVRPRVLRYSLFTLMATLAAWASIHFQDVPWYRRSVLFYFLYFIVGFLLADVAVDLWKGQRAKTWGWDLASLLGWGMIAIFVYFDDHVTIDGITPFVCIGIFLAYAGALRGYLSSSILSFGFIPIIGGMCYTIYLYHFYVIILASHITFRLLKGHSFLPYLATQSLLILPLIAVVSAIMFALVERPCMDSRWPARLWSKWRSAESVKKQIKKL